MPLCSWWNKQTRDGLETAINFANLQMAACRFACYENLDFPTALR